MILLFWTLWRNPSDQLVRVYLIPVSQLSHLDITNITIDRQLRFHLKDNDELYPDLQKYFIYSSLLSISNDYQFNRQCHYHIPNKI